MQVWRKVKYANPNTNVNPKIPTLSLTPTSLTLNHNLTKLQAHIPAGPHFTISHDRKDRSGFYPYHAIVEWSFRA